MNTAVLNKVEEGQYKKRPNVRVGDTVKLHLKIKEENKERTQIFKGVVISIKGSGASKNLVVRKISYGIGVEKIVPLHSPMLEKIEVVKRGSVRRSKLYYLRQRVGKKALKVGMEQDIYLTDEEEEKIIEEDIKERQEKQKEEEKEKKEESKDEKKEEEVESKE